MAGRYVRHTSIFVNVDNGDELPQHRSAAMGSLVALWMQITALYCLGRDSMPEIVF